MAQLESCDHPESREGVSVPWEAQGGASTGKRNALSGRGQALLRENYLMMLYPRCEIALCTISQPWHSMQGEAVPVFLGPDSLCLGTEVRAGLMRTDGEAAIVGSPGPLCCSEPVQTGSHLSRCKSQQVGGSGGGTPVLFAHLAYKCLKRAAWH